MSRRKNELLDEAAKRLPGLLVSSNPEKQAEAERLIAEYDSRYLATDLFQHAAERLQNQAMNAFRSWWILWWPMHVVEMLIKHIWGKHAATQFFFAYFFLFVGLGLRFLWFVVRRADKRPLFAVVSRWLTQDNYLKLFPFLLDCWQPNRNAPQNVGAEQALTEWLTRHAITTPAELSPEQVSKFCKQVRKLFWVVRLRDNVVRVVPRGAFTDTRADLLITLFQHLMLRSDIQTHERKPERDLLAFAAQMQATTENHALVRDAAQVLLQSKPVPVTVTAKFPTYSTTPQTSAVTVLGQRKP